MALPQQVLNQIAAADEMVAKMNIQQPLPVTVVQPGDATVVLENGSPIAVVEAAPAPDAQLPLPGVAPAPPVVAPLSNEDLAHRLSSAEGRVRSLTEANSTLLARCQSMQQQLNERHTPPAPDLTPNADFELTDEERNDFGPELVRVIEKRSNAMADRATAALRTQIADLSAKVSGTTVAVGADARNRMLQGLDNMVYAGKPLDWRVVNETEGWKLWLAQPDPFSGAERNTLLNEAYNKNDGARVARFFMGYLTEEAATVPSGLSGTPNPAEHGRVPVASLEGFAAPGRAPAGAGAAPPPDMPVFTQAEVQRFYADVRKGVFRGKEAEKDNIERQIFAATAAGRITP